jgi:DNA-binding NarL/FixJ family response regulator
MKTIKVHVTDDHPVVVEQLVEKINKSDFACVTGFSLKLSDCRDALALVRPDVLLLDVNMPDGSGAEFCSEMRQKFPKMKIIMFTSHEEYSIVNQLIKNGASGYIAKADTMDNIFDAIETVMQNETYYSPRIVQIINAPVLRITLTPREKQTLQLVAWGMTNEEISAELRVALSTILSYRKKLNLKLGATNSIELINSALKHGFLILKDGRLCLP